MPPPASSPFPSSSSDGRGKWKRKRKRHPQITPKKPLDDLDDDADEEAAVDGHSLDPHHGEDPDLPNGNSQLLDPNPVETEVVSVGGGASLSEFPSVTRLVVSRPHASVMTVVAVERANSGGDSSRIGGGGGQEVPSLENMSYGQMQAVSALPGERREGGESGYVVTPPKIMEGKGVVKRFGNRVHVVPMHSDWFSPITVHRMERQVVPQFFSAKSPEHTPEKYMECRNYIVARYMENPENKLTVSDCQSSVVGVDNEDLTRIVRFLDHWGIINYFAAPPGRESWNSMTYLMEDPNGEVHVPSAALKSIDSLIKFDKPKCRLRAADVYSSLSCHGDDFPDLDNKIRERLSENYCNYCSQPLPNVYYQSQKEVDVLLCSDCFHEGRFVSVHSSLDFVKMDSTKDYGDIDGGSWSDQETLLLLEAMEICNENWNEIAEHVGTKSKAQCILHFLRLPMEDGLLESVEVPKMNNLSNSININGDAALRSSLNGSCLEDADSESRLPFANSGNPVMALVAFLASAIGPRIAAACAHASLAALSEDDRMISERSHGREGSVDEEAANSLQQKEDRVHGSWGQNEAEVSPLPAEKVKVAAKAGLAAAATKAKLFADHEEREIQRLSANIINHQLKRLELKLKQFAEVETFLMRECEQVEKTRQKFTVERARMLSTRMGPAGVTSQMNLSAAAPSMFDHNIGTNRPQVMSAPSSQSNISGYSTNPQVHPHMSFMQRGQPQAMFQLGPRLPLSAIHPSSLAPSNAMFNVPANSQPNANQMMRSLSGPGTGLS